MDEASQWATATLVLAFAAVVLVSRQFYIENRTARYSLFPAAHANGVDAVGSHFRHFSQLKPAAGA
jgi:hypothetical protein